MQRYFSTDRMEGFFVKNLENVQGDERDVMVFSIGYGRDRTGRMTMGFGPLNQAGGERRLNVAVTRAREKIILVSSIRAADVDVAATQAPGVRALHKYLDYAERGIDALELVQPAQTGDFESPLERDVAQAIRQMGYDVVPQVGCSGFRLDLGVLDPVQPGRFLLGVECDGASYHSSYVARDKDRLRQEVLQRLGWRIHRVWSPDWVSRRGLEINRLRAAIEDARRAAEDGSETGNDSSASPLATADLPAPRIRAVVIDDRDSTPDTASWTTTYPVATPRVTRSRRDTEFHLPENRSEQARIVEAVVEVEGPIHVDLVCRRLAQAWGLQRLGSRVYAAAKAAVRKASRGGKVRRDGDFLWPSDPQFHLQVRVPVRCDPETQRRIEHIACDELGLAMRHIVKAGIGVSRDALVVETARVFGFERTGHQIREHLERVVQDLLDRDQLLQRGDRLYNPEPGVRDAGETAVTTSKTADHCALTLDRTEFVKALKDIARFRRRRGGSVRFSYSDGELAIAMPDVTIRVAAQGTWPTEVRMAGEWVKRMARVPPPDDPVSVTYDGTQVRIGTTVIPAVGAQ